MKNCGLQEVRVPCKEVLAENGFKKIRQFFRLVFACRVLPDGFCNNLFLVFFQAGLLVVSITGKQDIFPILFLFYNVVHLALVNEFAGMFPGQFGFGVRHREPELYELSLIHPGREFPVDFRPDLLFLQLKIRIRSPEREGQNSKEEYDDNVLQA
jgi:hypothetical protein